MFAEKRMPNPLQLLISPTTIPRDKLIDVFTFIVKSTFNYTLCKFVSPVCRNQAYWIKGVRNTCFIYNSVQDCLMFKLEIL